MKTINNYIQESLIKKNSKIGNKDIITFAKFFDIEIDDARWLYNDYYNNIQMWKEIYNDEWSQQVSYFTPFESLVFIADLLINDNNKCELYQKLGKKSYPGESNPYDFSVWTDENEHEVTLFEYVVYWIDRHFNEFKKIFDFLNNLKHKNSNAQILDVYYIHDGNAGSTIQDLVPCEIKKFDYYTK